jgi:hypothetical protein
MSEFGERWIWARRLLSAATAWLSRFGRRRLRLVGDRLVGGGGFGARLARVRVARAAARVSWRCSAIEGRRLIFAGPAPFLQRSRGSRRSTSRRHSASRAGGSVFAHCSSSRRRGLRVCLIDIVCDGSMAIEHQRIAVGKRSKQKMVN